ncbi:uncharacterized protein LOC129725574 [Wyeomyia smithii]|uniref:uncharacterized protein LOC129725574 n=1 Tax=Wyeomyia smithii TaxID=174621 RepID=UPI00246820E1|nr:uncharacterized protein LOC129725574 [Wyeomyia smithii]
MVLQCLKMNNYISKSGIPKYRLADALPIEDEITQLHRRRSSRMVQLEQTTLLSDGQLKFPRTMLTANVIDSPQEKAPSKLPSQPVNCEHHFVDVASYECGSVFGVGEHMDDRTVVARGRVQCLLIPRYWLLQRSQNANNVWGRIRVFLEQQQPSREQLFKWFLNELRWQKYRRELRTNFASVHVVTNETRIHDAPLLCRIEQADVFR